MNKQTRFTGYTYAIVVDGFTKALAATRAEARDIKRKTKLTTTSNVHIIQSSRFRVVR